MTASVLYERPATARSSVEAAVVGNPGACSSFTTRDVQDSDVYDGLVRLLRPRQDAARVTRARVRGDLSGRRPGVPATAARPDRRLDGSADPRRRPADRRLHGALAARPE